MKFNIYLLGLFICLGTASCLNDEFLEKFPEDSQTEATAFHTYNNFLTYSRGLYAPVFPGFIEGQGFYGYGDRNADLLFRGAPNAHNPYTWGEKTVPTSGGGWDFKYIRRVNIMLDNIEGSQMEEDEKAHWRSVGYFFRAYRYFQLLADFGDVPWLEHVVKDNDTEVLYGKKDSRDVVAKNIMDNLIWAEEHIRVNGDGDNTINRDVVRALISRFALFEGTWRKYHGLSDADTYLELCAEASAKLIEKYPEVHDNYDEVNNSENLAGVKGILLYNEYVAGVLMHSLSNSCRTTSNDTEMCKAGIELYLTTNGLPIKNANNTQYAGDKTMYDEFRNRDLRLLYTVVPPYQVNVGPVASAWSYTDNPVEREYIDLMETLTLETGKRLPIRNWGGNVTNCSPHFRDYPKGQAFCATYGGYYVYKYYSRWVNVQGADIDDCPIFRMGEVMLNYAEAMFEQGRFDQSIADATINRLRVRANVAPMQVAQITAAFDPARDPEVDPVLWEIRRERAVELMAEGFRLRDIKRWKKGEYLNKEQLGVYIRRSDGYPAAIRIQDDAPEGYVTYHGVPKVGWQDYYYLEPIPLNDLALNPNLVQNDGWENK